MNYVIVYLVNNPEKNGLHLATIIDHIAAPGLAYQNHETLAPEHLIFGSQLYDQAEDRLSLVIRDVSLRHFPASSIVIESFAKQYAEQKEPASPRRSQSIQDIYTFGGRLGLATEMFSYPREFWQEHHHDVVSTFADLLEFDQMPAEETQYDDFESAILDDLVERMTYEQDDPKYHYEAMHIGYHNSKALGHLSIDKQVILKPYNETG